MKKPEKVSWIFLNLQSNLCSNLVIFELLASKSSVKNALVTQKIENIEKKFMASF